MARRCASVPAFRDHACWSCRLHETFVGEPRIHVTLSRQALAVVTSALAMTALVAFGLGVAMLTVFEVCVGSISVEAARGGSHGGGTGWWDLLPWARLALVGLATAGAVLIRNARQLPDRQVLRQVSKLDRLPAAAAADRAEARRLGEILAGAIRIRTVSFDYSDPEGSTADLGKLEELHALLREAFPLVHEHLELTMVGGHSMVYEWRGSDPSLPVAMLCAHLDVVPVVDPSVWKHDPFGGHIDDEGVIWGRGAIDNKHNVVAQLAAVEQLLAGGQGPRRTLILAFGHDEEVGGKRGAAKIAELLEARGTRAEFILDEGPMIISGGIPGHPDMAVGYIGNCEKGALNVRMEVEDVCEAGHSSSPPLGESNVGVLSQAIAKLESRPFAPHIDSYLETMRFIGPHLPWPLRIVAGNPWLFARVLQELAVRNQRLAPLVRTTTSVTVVRAGSKVNSVPGKATAFVNHRIHPGDVSPERVLAYDKQVIDDPRVKLSPLGMDGAAGGWTPLAPISRTDSYGFRSVQITVAEIFGVPVAPMIMTGNTDTRHYWNLSSQIFRFSPIMINVDDVKMFHGPNERISCNNLFNLAHFYRRLLRHTVVMDVPSFASGGGSRL